MNLSYKLENGIFKFDTHMPLVLGTAGKAFNNIDYLKNRDDAKTKELDLLGNHLKIEKSSIMMLNQVHGDTIINVDNYTDKLFPVADGLITGTGRFCLVIRTADCVPVFIYDKKNNILGAAHSGWKGCRLNISGTLVRKMKSEYNSEVTDLQVFILPSIGPESYIIKMDVGAFFKNDILENNGKIYLNLWKNIHFSMKNEGIPDKNIHISEICTYKSNSDLFSYRHGDTGRNLNFAFIETA